MVKNILYCEDNPKTASRVSRAIRAAFIMQNPNIILAESLAKAMQSTAQKSLDLVITDGNLLGRDNGWDLADELRARGYTGPIIYAGGRKTDIPEGRERVFNDLLQKPFYEQKDVDPLIEAVRKYI